VDDQARRERDPVALQLELLEIDRQILERQPILETKHKAFQESKAEYEVEKLRLRILKERRSGLQSVLKSLTIV
jgi:hypothetical protein